MSLICNDCAAQIAAPYRICPQCGGRQLRPSGAPMASAAATMHQPVQPLVAAPVTGPLAYGGFWRRLAAYGIDVGLLVVVFFCIGMVIGLLAPDVNAQDLEAAFNLLGVLVFWVYHANMESGPRQATFGKRVMGLKVCAEDGQPLSFGRASGRFFGKFLSGLLLGIGFLMVAFTARKQGLHDQLVSAVVVRAS